MGARTVHLLMSSSVAGTGPHFVLESPIVKDVLLHVASGFGFEVWLLADMIRPPLDCRSPETYRRDETIERSDSELQATE